MRFKFAPMAKASNLQSLQAFYRQRFAAEYSLEPLKISPSTKVIIVVPAYYENPDYLLKSIEQCALTNPNEIALIWLVNQAEGDEHYDFHKKQVLELKKRKLANELKIYPYAVLDLKSKQAGVGLARKIGMDLALETFAAIDFDGLIVCLDGDCKVSGNYLHSLLKLAHTPVKGLAIHFEHPLEGLSLKDQEYIIKYETWLRYYSQALEWSGLAWYHHTVGSSMACRASTYAQIGGMNRRKAGEDFYFLHKLMPQGNFVSTSSAVVYPQARISERVPFGTGRAMLEMKAGNKSFMNLYNPLIFKILKDIISIENLRAGKLANNAYWLDFIKEHLKIESSYQALLKRVNTSNFPSQFLLWFDGFKVLKFVHHLQSTIPDLPAKDALQELLGISADPLPALIELRQRDRNRGRT